MTEQEYKKEIDYIFNRFPSFQKVGAGAYKPGIEGMALLAQACGNPHLQFRSIHVAGTNGKGSTSHMIAAALSRIPRCAVKWGGKDDKTPAEECGNESDYITSSKLKVGLYTSPHLVDFRERIKVSSDDGFQMITEEFVYNFIMLYKRRFEEIGASFFEITTAMAFAWFAHSGVDIAVVECGLGGRLDSTNILTPQLSVITNIGLDHCDFLGSEPESIALEKAGIIKPSVPVVIGEESGVGNVFAKKARECGSPLVWAEKYQSRLLLRYGLDLQSLDLQGACQDKNIKTVTAAVELWIGTQCNGLPSDERLSADNGPIVNEGILCGNVLSADDLLSADNDMHQAKGYSGESEEAGGIAAVGKEKEILEDVVAAIHGAAKLTGLRGRWEVLGKEPFIVCDTGHNSHGFKLLGKQIMERFVQGRFKRLVMFFGVVADKDLDSISEYLPKSGVVGGCGEGVVQYRFVNARGTRSLPAYKLKERMAAMGFEGSAVHDGNIGMSLQHYMDEVSDRADLSETDMVFIGGSTFVVAEAIEFFDGRR